MSTAKKTGGLKSLALSRIAAIVADLTGERPKKYKDKNSAIKAIPKTSKQNLVLATLRTGGMTVGEIEGAFGISRAYARDIISKLELRGEKISRDDDKRFSA